MGIHDELGERMKAYYENIPKTKLLRRTPVAIRIDGKAFHTFTRGFDKPFDSVFMNAMKQTMKYLCENVQGCVLGYTQSDEITLILVDYKNLNSSAWFDYEVQKMCSIAASMATMAFNKAFKHECAAQTKKLYTEYLKDKDVSYINALEKAMNKGAMFDARVFNIPKEEVTNLLYWRQLDAIRNSVQMVGQANFSQSELKNKSQEQIKNMLLSQKNIDWNSLPLAQQRGSCCVKKEYLIDEYLSSPIKRSLWIIDEEIPIFKADGRAYIEELITF